MTRNNLIITIIMYTYICFIIFLLIISKHYIYKYIYIYIYIYILCQIVMH